MSKFNRHLVSYRYALHGIAHAFRYEQNMRIHVAAATAVILLNIFLKVSRSEWLITLVLIGLVLAVEIFNTAIEKLADRITTEHDPLIGRVKDLASGAVLMICIFAVICAGIIYLPYFQ